MRLEADSCAGGITLEFNESLTGTVEMERLEVEVWSDFPAPQAGTFVTLTGRFAYREGSRPSKILRVTAIAFAPPEVQAAPQQRSN